MADFTDKERSVWEEGFRVGVTKGDIVGTASFEECVILRDEEDEEIHLAHIKEEGRLYGYAFGYETAQKGNYETEEIFKHIVLQEYTAKEVISD